jgi:4-hydroxyphenylacetate 3-monooxygenase
MYQPTSPLGDATTSLPRKFWLNPQADRSADPGKSPGLLRLVRKEANGVRLRGAKSVASIAAQADEIIFSNLLKPNFPAEACVWAAIPVATEGLKALRPAVSQAWRRASLCL